MEIRTESVIRVQGNIIPTMFIEFVNPPILMMSEEGLGKSVKEFAEKHKPNKLFPYGSGSYVANTISTCIDVTRATPK